jgi:hypothetical protein
MLSQVVSIHCVENLKYKTFVFKIQNIHCVENLKYKKMEKYGVPRVQVPGPDS